MPVKLEIREQIGLERQFVPCKSNGMCGLFHKVFWFHRLIFAVCFSFNGRITLYHLCHTCYVFDRDGQIHLMVLWASFPDRDHLKQSLGFG